ncbi:MAG: diguanylate cyclase [Nitrospirae bacterium]|nr:diguanylate cyclase [Candidatus Troglogloeales bacterium]MBI3598110.1 diguanylate cyclase [Candidatus Troglogloeales bacterium]
METTAINEQNGESPAMMPAREPLKILLVDDDDISMELVSCALRKSEGTIAGCEARSLREARALLEKESFDCALIDYHLPDGNGVSLIEEIKNSKAWKLPTILLTAQGSERLAVEVMKKGAFDYISKSDITAEVLFRAIRSAIALCKSEDALAERTKKLIEVNGELKEANMKLTSLTRMDPLTEVLNRRGFQEVLTRECQYALREGQHFIVLLVDIDSFKQINDTMGHDAGDAVLETVAKRLGERLRATDYVARIGGDEFMLLLRKTLLIDGVEVAHKMRLAIAEPIPWGNGMIEITASIGLAMVNRTTRSIDELLARTHGALARCKEAGKNRVVCDNEEGGVGEAQGKESMWSSLSLLRQGDGLRVVAQPIFRINPSAIAGYEFLSRSHVTGYEMPNDFFPLAAEAQMLSYVDRLCFEKCVLSTLSFSASLKYHINIFPSTLLSVSPENLLKVFPSERLKGNYFIEFSEKQFKGNMLDFVKGVDQIRESGVQLVIEDIGFGHTCLETLIALRPHSVKVDLSCSNNVANDAAKRHSLERLVKLMWTLECETMVKGVESQDDLSVLSGLGVSYAQGKLFKSREEDKICAP